MVERLGDGHYVEEKEVVVKIPVERRKLREGNQPVDLHIQRGFRRSVDFVNGVLCNTINFVAAYLDEAHHAFFGLLASKMWVIGA